MWLKEKKRKKSRKIQKRQEERSLKKLLDLERNPEKNIKITLKSGNFGQKDFFSRALKKL